MKLQALAFAALVAPTAISALVAVDIAVAFAKGFAGKGGAAIFDSIFGTGDTDYFEQDNRIRQLVKEELTKEEIDKINGELNGVADYMVKTYQPVKNEGTAHNVLLNDHLLPQLQSVENSVGILKSDRYKEDGLAVFLIAASMVLSISQEMAYVDDVVDDPAKSGYATSVSEYAKEYKKHANTVYNTLLNRRLGKISGIQAKAAPFVANWYFNDGYTGKKYDSKVLVYFGTSPDGKKWEKLYEGMVREQSSVTATARDRDFPASLGEPPKVIQAWDRLIGSPVKSKK